MMIKMMHENEQYACGGKYFMNDVLCNPCEFGNMNECYIVQRYKRREIKKKMKKVNKKVSECSKAIDGLIKSGMKIL